MISAILYQLTRNLTPAEIKAKGFDAYFVDHTTGIYPQAASGTPFSAGGLSCSGDIFADLNEDLAAEQKARLSYDNILRLVDDPDVKDAIRFLRAREIVHYQRFGEALRIAQDKVNSRNFYAFNPSFDTPAANLITTKTCGKQQKKNAHGRVSMRISGCRKRSPKGGLFLV